MIDQLQALDTRRFKDGPLGHLAGSEMTLIEQRLTAVLGML
jgi:mRNA-degrading endonuclease toxin of MazEF toxin-antitoxin module